MYNKEHLPLCCQFTTNVNRLFGQSFAFSGNPFVCFNFSPFFLNHATKKCAKHLEVWNIFATHTHTFSSRVFYRLFIKYQKVIRNIFAVFSSFTPKNLFELSCASITVHGSYHSIVAWQFAECDFTSVICLFFCVTPLLQ